MTSLREHTGRPEVAPWLRGWVDEPPQTTVVWREHLPPSAGELEPLAEFFEAAPPHVMEGLSTETWRVVEWFSKRADKLQKREAGAEAEVAADRVVAVALSGAHEPVACWTRAELRRLRDRSAKDRLERTLAGRTLVVWSCLGGLSADGLLSEAVDDAPPTVDGSDDRWPSQSPGEGPSVPFRIGETARAEPLGDGEWQERLRIPIAVNEDEDVARWLVVERWRRDAATEEDRSFGSSQTLREHQAWTANEVDGITARLGLAEDLRRVLRIAARLHDEGKRAQRWQRAFRAPADDVYAKTRGPLNPRLLDGYRHELGSLPLAAADPELQALPSADRDLVLHLIAAHHGFARPVIGTRSCDDLPPSAIEVRAREVALRFVALQDRYGPWGLAWLEALLRAADQRASRANDERRSG